jgi:hypothetical protein
MLGRNCVTISACLLALKWQERLAETWCTTIVQQPMELIQADYIVCIVHVR